MPPPDLPFTWGGGARAWDTGRLAPENGLPALLSGLKLKNQKAVELAVGAMADCSNIDLFYWFEYIEKTSGSPCGDLEIFCRGLWAAMEAAHLREHAGPADEMLSLLLQISVRDFVADMRRCRPSILSELVQKFKHNQRELGKLAETHLMRTLIKEQAKEGVMIIYHIEVMFNFVLLFCFSYVTYVFKFA